MSRNIGRGKMVLPALTSLDHRASLSVTPHASLPFGQGGALPEASRWRMVEGNEAPSEEGAPSASVARLERAAVDELSSLLSSLKQTPSSRPSSRRR